MLAAGEPINEWNADQDTALTQASHNADIDMVNLLLNHGANPNKPSGWPRDRGYVRNFSPLMWSSAHGGHNAVMIMQALLKHGADINAEDAHGNQALYFSTLTDIDSVALLIQKGADVNHQNEKGCRALEFAIFTGKDDIEKISTSTGCRMWHMLSGISYGKERVRIWHQYISTQPHPMMERV